MKKLLLATFAVLVGTLSQAQSLNSRKDTEESLSIRTNYLVEGQQLGVSLDYVLNKATNEEIWGLSIVLYSRNVRFNVDKGSKLLIRTFSDNIIELKQIKEFYHIYQRKEYPYERANDYNTTDWLLDPYYFIETVDLEKIMNEGVKKMRFETSKGMKDLEWEKDVFGQMVLSEYNLILEKSNFEKDF